MRWTIARIERSSPPGVSSWMMSAWACSAWARSMARPTRRRVTGLITPSISIVATGCGGADERLAHERAHQHERFIRGKPADLRRPGAGREGRIDGVDVERAVDRAAAQAGEPLRDPGGPLLLHGLDAGDLDPVLVVELE